MTAVADVRVRKRRLNAAIRASATDESLPFVCECAAAGCFGVVWLGARGFDEGRADPSWQVLAARHRAVTSHEMEEAA